MHRIVRLLALGAMAVLLPSLARGQVDTAPRTEQAAQQGARAHKDLTQTSIVRLPDIAVSLTASKGEKKVEGHFGFSFGSFVLDTKVEGPLDDSQDDTDLVTLDGLSSGSTFDIGLSHLWWNPSADADRQKPICLAFQRSQAKELAKAKEIGTGPLVCNLLGLPKESYYQQYQDARTDARRKEVCDQYALSLLQDPAAFKCDPEALPRVSPREQWDDAIDWSIPFSVGGRWTTGWKKFKWADTASGDFMSDNEVPWEIAFGANVLLPRNVALAIEYRHQSDYEEESKRTVCQPLASTTATTCRELAFGKYTHKERELATFTLRKWLGAFAADVRYSFDFSDSIHAIEVPVYFLSTEGKGLSGGIAAGWSSKDDGERHGATVRAFIGNVLDIWPTW